MRYIDAWKMEGCVYTIYQNNEGNRFYILRKEKDGNSNQLRVAFKSAEDAKTWVNNVLIPAWKNWHDCNKLAGQVYLDDSDELNETKNTNKNMKKQTIKLNESQLRNFIKDSIKKVLMEHSIVSPFVYDPVDKTRELEEQGWTPGLWNKINMEACMASDSFGIEVSFFEYTYCLGHAIISVGDLMECRDIIQAIANGDKINNSSYETFRDELYEYLGNDEYSDTDSLGFDIVNSENMRVADARGQYSVGNIFG